MVTILVSTITQITTRLTLLLVSKLPLCLRFRLWQVVWLVQTQKVVSIVQTPLREEEGDIALLYHHLTRSTTNPDNIELLKAQEPVEAESV